MYVTIKERLSQTFKASLSQVTITILLVEAELPWQPEHVGYIQNNTSSSSISRMQRTQDRQRTILRNRYAVTVKLAHFSIQMKDTIL